MPHDERFDELNAKAAATAAMQEATDEDVRDLRRDLKTHELSTSAHGAEAVEKYRKGAADSWVVYTAVGTLALLALEKLYPLLKAALKALN